MTQTIKRVRFLLSSYRQPPNSNIQHATAILLDVIVYPKKQRRICRSDTHITKCCCVRHMSLDVSMILKCEAIFIRDSTESWEVIGRKFLLRLIPISISLLLPNNSVFVAFIFRCLQCCVIMTSTHLTVVKTELRCINRAIFPSKFVFLPILSQLCRRRRDSAQNSGGQCNVRQPVSRHKVSENVPVEGSSFENYISFEDHTTIPTSE